MSDASPALQLVGAVLNGRWRLVRLLGEGGMGAVFEADGVRGEGKRAIKLLHEEYVKEEQVLSRFFAEAQAVRALQHPNVAQIYEAQTAENGTPYLVMELLQGMPLASYMEGGQQIPVQQAVSIVYGVLQALGHAHSRRIVHRDLKPDNLFMVRDAAGGYQVKVLDFGIAKVMDAAGGMGQKTRTGVLLGTPGYMSPEQIKNSKAVDARSDLWSLAIIFYEMLTQKTPFPADNEFARLTAVLTEEVKPIEQVAPQHAAWAQFFRRALAKEPAQRFQSAEEMSAALVAVSRGGQPQQPEYSRPQASYAQVAQSVQAQYSAQPAQSAQASYSQQAYSQPAHTAQPGQGAYAQQSQSQPRSARAGATLPSTPPPPPPGGIAATVPAGLGNVASTVPTHVSGQRPPGVPSPQGYSPSIEVVQPGQAAKGAAWWIVGVVAFVSFGLGLAVGLVVGG